ncbi:hypothetical protein Gogos_018128 [Gossypium gossypioides]|uniref:CCHC-type domain-containing protein n=1 Tax=Gossypium gossypioides TaxID=34282 RepID=A0A7J9BCX8_GOSGO|nr:hypothetical protein [Gossypium gossypioides]
MMAYVSRQQNIEAKLDFLCFKSRDKSFIVSRHLSIEARGSFNQGLNSDRDSDMAVDLEPESILSWKDRLLGCVEGGYLNEDKDEIEFTDGDIIRSLVNEIPTIRFSNRVNKLLIKNMATTVVLKLLGHSIGYNALQNKVSTLWRPSSPFQPIRVLFKAWIRLPGLLGFLYKIRILEEIGGMIGKVAKLDFNTDSRMRGKFVRMAIYVNLDKLLVSQVIINGTIQRVEFESFPVVCFTCGCYGHMKEVCLRHGLEVSPPEKKDMAEETVVSTVTEIQHAEETIAYSPWMIIERRPRHNFRDNNFQRVKKSIIVVGGSRFGAFNSRDLIEGDLRIENRLVLSGQEKLKGNFMVADSRVSNGKAKDKVGPSKIGQKQNLVVGLVVHVGLETNEENLGSASPGLERRKLLDNVSRPVGMEVSLQNGVLDPGRHSVISFKVNKDSLDGKPVNKNNSVETMEGIHVGKGRETGGKVYSNKNGKVLNRTLRGRGKRFKASGNL